MNIHTLFIKKIQTITSDQRWTEAREILTPKVTEITNAFYSELQQVPDLNRILANKVVDRRLHDSLENWLHSLLKTYHDEDDIFRLISNQQVIGNVHAKINLDIASFTYGLGVIKGEICQHLQQYNITADDYQWMVQSVNQLIDIANTFITESFFLNQIKHEQQENSLRIVGIIENIAVECERLRSSLFDWGRLTVPRIYEVSADLPTNVISLKDSDFGLWVMYKSEYLNQPGNVTQNLWDEIAKIDNILNETIEYRKKSLNTEFLESLNVFNNSLTKLSAYISTIADHSLDAEKSTDTLTQVLNRRYMNTILRRLTNISIRESVIFSVLLVDIDDFKIVNDKHGHQNGDTILSAFAGRLMHNLKKSDFIFRYGGEEFLIVLGSTGKDEAESFAQNICLTCENKSFLLNNDSEIQMTCSIGIATHDGHPDFTRLIEKADTALYRAKVNGKNQARYHA